MSDFFCSLIFSLIKLEKINNRFYCLGENKLIALTPGSWFMCIVIAIFISKLRIFKEIVVHNSQF